MTISNVLNTPASGGAIVTSGAAGNPLPADVTVILVTTPAVIVAVALAFVPAEFWLTVTLGAVKYPDPPFTTAIEATLLPTESKVTVAVAVFASIELTTAVAAVVNVPPASVIRSPTT